MEPTAPLQKILLILSILFLIFVLQLSYETQFVNKKAPSINVVSKVQEKEPIKVQKNLPSITKDMLLTKEKNKDVSTVQPLPTPPDPLHVPSYANQSAVKETTIKKVIDPLDPFQDQWKTVYLDEKTTFHIYSAFALKNEKNQVYDQVRISAAIPSAYEASPKAKGFKVPSRISENTKCIFETDNKGIIVSSSVKIEVQREHFGLKWSSCYLFCSVTKSFAQTKLKNVYVVHKDSKSENLPNTSALRVHYPELDAKETNVKMQKMAVCVKPLHNQYNRGLWLVEFLEMYRIQGATHFMFYNHSLGPDVESILAHYNKIGLTTILKWNLPLSSQKEIRTEAIFTAINDCNMRAAWQYEYLAVVDLDEYILPSKSTNLTSFLDAQLKSHKSAAYFLFQNVFHYLYWENSTSLLDQEWKNKVSKHPLPFLVTQTKLRRIYQPHRHSIRSKYVTRPDKVLDLGNHNIWKSKQGYGQVRIAAGDGLSHHYRICEFGGTDCVKIKSEIDKTALKWGSHLIERVDKICQTIFGDGKSCPKPAKIGSPPWTLS